MVILVSVVWEGTLVTTTIKMAFLSCCPICSEKMLHSNEAFFFFACKLGDRYFFLLSSPEFHIYLPLFCNHLFIDVYIFMLDKNCQGGVPGTEGSDLL